MHSIIFGKILLLHEPTGQILSPHWIIIPNCRSICSKYYLLSTITRLYWHSYLLCTITQHPQYAFSFSVLYNVLYGTLYSVKLLHELLQMQVVMLLRCNWKQSQNKIHNIFLCAHSIYFVFEIVFLQVCCIRVVPPAYSGIGFCDAVKHQNCVYLSLRMKKYLLHIIFKFPSLMNYLPLSSLVYLHSNLVHIRQLRGQHFLVAV